MGLLLLFCLFLRTYRVERDWLLIGGLEWNLAPSRALLLLLAGFGMMVGFEELLPASLLAIVRLMAVGRPPSGQQKTPVMGRYLRLIESSATNQKSQWTYGLGDRI